MSTRVEGPAPRHGIQAMLPILLLFSRACARYPAD
jgi:hypothetical protein